MCLRGEAVVARCLVRYGSTGRDGRIWVWGDQAVLCRRRIEDWWRNGTARRWQFGSREDEGIGGDPVDDG